MVIIILKYFNIQHMKKKKKGASHLPRIGARATTPCNCSIPTAFPENARATVQHARNLAGECVSHLHRSEWRKHLGAPHIQNLAWSNGWSESNRPATKLPCRSISFLFFRTFPMMLSVKWSKFLSIPPVSSYIRVIRTTYPKLSVIQRWNPEIWSPEYYWFYSTICSSLSLYPFFSSSLFIYLFISFF